MRVIRAVLMVAAVLTAHGAYATCSTGYMLCAGTCIPSHTCCTNASCTGGQVCSGVGGSCSCPSGTRICYGMCVSTTGCCSSSDCINPPSQCQVQMGTCSSGKCSYANKTDTTPCNADNNECTANDTCMGGACVKGAPVTCVAKDCQTSLGCQPDTGACLYANANDGTSCGDNGCNAQSGACKSGTCTAMPKDCSALDTDCTMGACDPSQPVTAACTATNKPNGIMCTTNNKCLPNPSCTGGVCGGTPTVCMPSGTCRDSTCDPSTGNCVEMVTTGASCALECAQNATCDSNGKCSGVPVPDATPCDKSGCSVGATCTQGVCTCLGAADFAGGNDAGTNDAATNSGHKSGCSLLMTSRTSPAAALPFALLLLAFAVVRTRRRAYNRGS